MNDLIINDVSLINIIKYNIKKSNYFTNIIIPINTSSKIPLHKYWILIDKCKIVGMDNNIILTALSLNSSCIKLINEIENKTTKKLSDDFCMEIILVSKLNDDGNFIPIFELLIDENTVMFNNNNKCQLGEEYSIIAELTYSIMTHEKITFIWRVVQMKKIVSINITESLFDKLENDSKPIIRIPPPPPPPLYPKVNFSEINCQEKIEKQQPPSTSGFVPSIADLSKALNKLKKIESPPQENIKKPGDIVIEVPQLKHVEIKETNFINTLKQEHINKTIEDEINIMIKLYEQFKIITDKRNKLYNSLGL